MRERSRAIRAVVSAAVGLLVLAGCVQLDGDLTINGTGSDAEDTISGTLLVAVADQWVLEHGEDPARLSDAIAEELAANAGGGLSGEPYAADGFTGSTLTLDEVPIERLATATDGALSITRESEAYVLRGDLSGLSPDDETDALPWTAHLAITFPEEVTEHNGTLAGRTVTWDLDASSEDATIFATSSVGPISWLSRVPVWLLAMTGVAGIGVLATWWWSRRRAGDGGAHHDRAGSVGRRAAEIFDSPEDD